ERLPREGDRALRRRDRQPGAGPRRHDPAPPPGREGGEGVKAAEGTKTRIAARVQALKPSETLALSARARELKAQGHSVISFAAGEPDFDTPEDVREAGVAAIRAGHTRYTAVSGIAELRQAIAENLKRENGLEYKPT